MICVCICALGYCFATNVTVVICVCIYALGYCFAANVTVVILVCICTLGYCFAANITVVICVCVCALGYCFAANVTLVILVCVCTLGNYLAANVTLVILVCVCTLGNYLAANVTLMIYVFVCTLGNCLTANVTLVIHITINMICCCNCQRLINSICNILMTSNSFVMISKVTKRFLFKLYKEIKQFKRITVLGHINFRCTFNIRERNISCVFVVKYCVCKRIDIHRCKNSIEIFTNSDFLILESNYEVINRIEHTQYNNLCIRTCHLMEHIKYRTIAQRVSNISIRIPLDILANKINHGNIQYNSSFFQRQLKHYTHIDRIYFRNSLSNEVSFN